MTARQAALDVLSNVLEKGSYLNLELKKVLRDGFSVEDRRFAAALTSTTIENIGRIDYILDQFISAKRVHKVIKNILRLGVCQLLFFESVPASAAVNESVKLAQSNGKKQLKGFVNGVLRNVAKGVGSIAYPQADDDFAYYLSVMYSYPRWLCEMYIADYGEEFTEQMLEYKGEPSLTCVRHNKIKSDDPPEGLGKGLYLSDAFYIKNATDIENMPAFVRGEITVQGEASMITVLAADVGVDDHVLDVCAAPGGKSAYAAQMACEGTVTAADIHSHRVELIKKTAERLGAENVEAMLQDATQYRGDFEEKFDIVLADVPCSALGLLNRKPDIKLHKRSDDIRSLVEIQREILETSARYVKPGGTLLYSTCTINKRENQENVEWFLEHNKNFRLDELKNYIPAALMNRAEGGMMQLYPHIDRVDGFFMARLVKA